MTEKFKSLTIKEKLEYIWDYYRLHITVVVVAIGLIASIAIGIITKIDYEIYCLIFNDTGNTALSEHIISTYSEYTNTDKDNVSVDMGFVFSPSEEAGFNWPDEASSVKLIQLYGTNAADVIITDYDSMLWAHNENLLTPLNELLPDELYNELEPYFVYAVFDGDTSEQGDGKVYGLDISNTDFYKGHSQNYEDAILCFPNVSKNPDAAVDFAKYVYGIASDEG